MVGWLAQSKNCLQKFTNYIYLCTSRWLPRLLDTSRLPSSFVQEASQDFRAGCAQGGPGWQV
eukprot:1157731-Pelagomonas_calceolata.AAC.9